MKCEEFEALGWDAERDSSLSERERAAAREHAGACARCANLQDSWERARSGLRAFAETTVPAQISPRVEMRLRQEFRTHHRNLKMRRAGLVTAWTLAAAAILVAFITQEIWRNPRKDNPSGRTPAQGVNSAAGGNSSTGNSPRTSGQQIGAGEAAGGQNSAEQSGGETLLAQTRADDFTLLPGFLPADTEDATILRVRMQRGSLTALGLPVNEEGAGEWIQVEMLVGNDGLPQAVRLPEQEN